MALKDLMRKENNPIKGLLCIEWITISYILFTLILTFIFWNRIPNVHSILTFRAIVLVAIILFWRLYLKKPTKLMHFLRVALQFGFLAQWYPDLYEFNRIFPNYDHIFANIEEHIFGFQPAIYFHQIADSYIFSEIMDLAYISYFPMILAIMTYYFIERNHEFDRASIILLGSFLVYYIIYIFLPVAGPQYYFNAIGLQNASSGIFPNIGHYFYNNLQVLPSPGWDKGLFHSLLVNVHHAGERPMASFPSSHVGIGTVVFLLSLKTKNIKFISVVGVFYVLMSLSTVYILAHYVVDSVAGLFSGIILFFIFYWLTGNKKCQYHKL